MVLEALHILLPGVHAMSLISRRTFGQHLLQLGAAALLSGVPIPTGKHISAGALLELQQALGESIAAGWKVFHTAGNAQVLAVGQAQLFLVQQNHAILPSRIRAGFYSSVYNLIGKAQHFRGCYQEALDAHMNAHIAAMSTGDPWDVVQSLICQADSYQALGQHSEAIEAIEEALRIIGNPADEEHMRIKAHLLACWADNEMVMEEYTMAQTKLEESAVFLDQISPNEEFDRTSWLQLAGKCALATRDHEKAIRYYTDALAELPPHWLIRQAFTLVPLMVAYACIREKNISLDIASKATSIISSLNAPIINQQFAASVELGLLGAFPNDDSVLTFVAGLKHRLPALAVAIQSN
jgi:tetratricopeptide (TPR) repeat protein